MEGDSWENSTISNGLVLLKNMNDISNRPLAVFQYIKASAKYFIF